MNRGDRDGGWNFGSRIQGGGVGSFPGLEALFPVRTEGTPIAEVPVNTLTHRSADGLALLVSKGQFPGGRRGVDPVIEPEEKGGSLHVAPPVADLELKGGCLESPQLGFRDHGFIKVFTAREEGELVARGDSRNTPTLELGDIWFDPLEVTSEGRFDFHQAVGHGRADLIRGHHGFLETQLESGGGSESRGVQVECRSCQDQSVTGAQKDKEREQRFHGINGVDAISARHSISQG